MHIVEVHHIIPKRFATPYEKKSWEEYRELFVTRKRIDKGKVFYQTHKETIERAADQYGVSSFLILSIVGVERAIMGATTNSTAFLILSTLKSLKCQNDPNGQRKN